MCGLQRHALWSMCLYYMLRNCALVSCAGADHVAHLPDTAAFVELLRSMQDGDAPQAAGKHV